MLTKILVDTVSLTFAVNWPAGADNVVVGMFRIVPAVASVVAGVATLVAGLDKLVAIVAWVVEGAANVDETFDWNNVVVGREMGVLVEVGKVVLTAVFKVVDAEL